MMTPFWTSILTTLILHVKYEKSQFITTIISFIGVIMICKPPFFYDLIGEKRSYFCVIFSRLRCCIKWECSKGVSILFNCNFCM